MVIVRLTGGLGNQLFQYATARRLASVNHVALKLDISDFAHDPSRGYSLKPFNVEQEFAAPEEIAQLKGRGLTSHLLYWKQKLLPSLHRTLLVERHFHFDPAVLVGKENVYLDGFWQSEQYFKDIEPIIRSELCVTTSPDSVNAAMAWNIQRVEAVSVHIRRGDYVSNPLNRRIHCVCSVDYYQRAIGMLIEARISPHLFIFSDEPEWVESHWKPDCPAVLVKHNGPDNAHEDLRLMSLCRHHIIANSTLSWWGAWLSQNPEKMVIAPKKWFSETKHDTRDLIPKGWHKI